MITRAQSKIMFIDMLQYYNSPVLKKQQHDV